MKNLILLFTLLFGFEMRAQINCPIFPKAKKQNTHFFSGTYTSLSAQAGIYEGKTISNSMSVHPLYIGSFGVTQCIKKRIVTHTLLSFEYYDGLNIGGLFGVDYFFKESFSGFGAGASISGYGTSAYKALNLVYGKRDRKFFNAYYLGGGFVGENYFFAIGIKIGVLVFRS